MELNYIEKATKRLVKLEVTNPGDAGDIHFRGPAGMMSLPSADFLAKFEPQLPAVNVSQIPTLATQQVAAAWGGSDEVLERLIEAIGEGNDRVVTALGRVEAELRALREPAKP